MSKFRLAPLAVFYLPSFWTGNATNAKNFALASLAKLSVSALPYVEPFGAFGTFLPWVESLWNLFFCGTFLVPIHNFAKKSHSNSFRAAISSKISARFARRSFLIHYFCFCIFLQKFYSEIFSDHNSWESFFFKLKYQIVQGHSVALENLIINYSLMEGSRKLKLTGIN